MENARWVDFQLVREFKRVQGSSCVAAENQSSPPFKKVHRFADRERALRVTDVCDCAAPENQPSSPAQKVDRFAGREPPKRQL